MLPCNVTRASKYKVIKRASTCTKTCSSNSSITSVTHRCLSVWWCLSLCAYTCVIIYRANPSWPSAVATVLLRLSYVCDSGGWVPLWWRKYGQGGLCQGRIMTKKKEHQHAQWHVTSRPLWMSSCVSTLIIAPVHMRKVRCPSLPNGYIYIYKYCI